MLSAILSISSMFCLSALDATGHVMPMETGAWLVPAPDDTAVPYWGLKDGIGVTVPTARGPRGLIGIQTPYLGLPELQVINFVAIEPIVNGQRGYSEMEQSKLDGVQGLRLWTTDDLDRSAKPGAARPARRRLPGPGSTACAG